MDENEITQRLRDAGDQPIPDVLRASHLSQMHATVPTVEKQKRFGRLAVAAAAFVGFAVGSTGFAMAGALPDPAQQVAHDVLAVVQVDVEDPKNRGQCISAAARSTTDPVAKQAAKDACPKGRPDHAGKGLGKAKGRPDHAGTPGGPNGVPHAGDPCKGPPPWAGKGGKSVTAEEKKAFQETRASCPDDELEQDEIEQDDAPEVELEEPAEIPAETETVTPTETEIETVTPTETETETATPTATETETETG